MKKRIKTIEKLDKKSCSRLVKEQTGFTQLSTFSIQNIKSMEALGLWTYLLSLPDNWVIRRSQLRDHFGIGKDKLKKAFDVLIKLFLVEEIALRDEKGHFIGNITKVNQGIPNFTPEAENPQADFPDAVKPTTTNDIDIKNNISLQKELLKNEKKEEDPMSVNIKSHIVNECRYIEAGAEVNQHEKYCHYTATKSVNLVDENDKSMNFPACDAHYRTLVSQKMYSQFGIDYFVA
jgi:hypothetical protein